MFVNADPNTLRRYVPPAGSGVNVMRASVGTPKSAGGSGPPPPKPGTRHSLRAVSPRMISNSGDPCSPEGSTLVIHRPALQFPDAAPKKHVVFVAPASPRRTTRIDTRRTA